jgi:hypothetical protein
MAKLRSVSTAFWSDPYVEGLTPTQKLLFLYLITNEKTNMIGIYESSSRKISFETGINEADVKKSLDQFTKDGKVKSVGNWILLANYMKHQNYNTNMKKAAIDAYLSIPKELQNNEIEIDRDNPIESFESLSNHYGMVPNHSGTVRKEEYEYEVESELESEPELNEKKKKISTLRLFESNRDILIQAAKENYPNKNCEHAFDDMLDHCKIKGAKYLDYKLAYFKWVRDDRFQKYDLQTTAGPRLKPEFRHIKNWEDKTYGETENLFYYTIFDVTQNAWRYIKASQQEKIRVSGIHGADKLISCHE